MGKLVLIPTPIGNLDDITRRAVLQLEACDVLFAEDTRTSGNLLRHLGISKPLKPFHLHNEHQALGYVISQIQSHNLVGLMSDAGTPGISDPGFLLVRACVEANIDVECLPGPAALIPALVVSGLPTDRFVFEGFLPHKKGRQSRFKKLEQEDRTIIFYESPHRLLKTLEQAVEFLGASRKAVVVREISKKFEQVHRGTLTELVNYFKSTAPKGEIVIVIEGYSAASEDDDFEELSEADILLRGRQKRKKA
jgi:16S rRNA (cytidine1402-2'-O)-methyltransferase